MESRTKNNLGNGQHSKVLNFRVLKMEDGVNTSSPRAAANHPKYRERPNYMNIMCDPRVVRGSTFSRHKINTTSQPGPIKTQKVKAPRWTRALPRSPTYAPNPKALKDRQQVNVQTKITFEELSNIVVCVDKECQFDEFLDRPPSPLFKPAKIGVDVGTQIEDRELFDFDLEVQPIVDVLVGKTIEQSLLEVMQEEEQASLKAQIASFNEIRNRYQAEVQRLQEQDRRLQEERKERIEQQKEAFRIEKEKAEKIAARAYKDQNLMEIVPSVFDTLRNEGFFHDPVQKEMETTFLPWLIEEVDKNEEKRNAAEYVLDEILRDIVQKKTE